MNKLLFIIFAFLTESHCYAQQLEVIFFEARPMDLFGRVNERLDMNGNKCAVLKIQVNDDIIDVSGMVGNVVEQGFEKNIYVTQETKKIKIKFAKHLPIIIDPKEYEIDKLIGGFTYEIYLKSKEEKKIDTVEKSTGILPQWINDVKEGQFVGISMPNNNAEAAKKQALAMAALQYVIYNGGAKVKIIAETQMGVQTNGNIDGLFYSEETNGNTLFTSTAKCSDFAVNISREYYNQNGEYFVLCDFIKDGLSKNIVEITKNSCVGRGAIDKFVEDSITAYELNRGTQFCSEIKFFINGVKCNITTSHDYSENKFESITRIDGVITFNNGYKYPNFSISEELNAQTFSEQLDLLSNSLGYSQLCFVTSIPNYVNAFHADVSQKQVASVIDTEYRDRLIFYCTITNTDSLTVSVKIKWGGVRNNQVYYSSSEESKGYEHDMTSYICQYGLCSQTPSLIMSKHFSFVEALGNMCLCLTDSTIAAKENLVSYIRQDEMDFYIKKAYLFPHPNYKDKKYNSNFAGVVLSSDQKLPYNLNSIIEKNPPKSEKKKYMMRITDTFSPLNVFLSENAIPKYSNLKPSGYAHQLLLLKMKASTVFKKRTIEMFGFEVTGDNNQTNIQSFFWN